MSMNIWYSGGSQTYSGNYVTSAGTGVNVIVTNDGENWSSSLRPPKRLAAAESGGAAAKEQVDALMDKGRDLVDSAAELIRERPLASFGVAFAAGWIIAKLARSGGDK